MASNLGTLVLKFVGDTAGVMKAFDQVAGRMNQANKAGSSGGGIGGALIGGGAAGAVFAGVSAMTRTFGTAVEIATEFTGLLKDAAVYAAKLGADFERSAIAMETLSGSTKVGQKLFTDLIKLAEKSPFSGKEFLHVGKKLLGAGFNPKDIVNITNSLGDLASGTGHDIELIAKALSDVKGKGRLMAQELNLQFGNAGIGAERFADALGLPTSKFLQMVEEGQVSVDMVLKAITNMTTGTGAFAGSQARDLQSVAGAWKQVTETINNAIGTFGKMAFEKFPIAKGLSKIADSFSGTNIESVLSQAEEVGKKLMPAVEAIGKFGIGVAFAAEQFITKLIPSADELGKGIAGVINNFGKPLFSLFVGLGEAVSIFFDLWMKSLESMVFGFRSLLKVMQVFEQATGRKAIGQETLEKSIQVFDAISTGATKFREAMGAVDTDKAFAGADEAWKKLMAAMPTGAGGASPMDPAIEAKRMQDAEVKARTAAHLEAVEAAMPGFKTGLDKLLGDALDPTKSLSSSGQFFRSMELLKKAQEYPDRYDPGAINRSMLSAWNAASGSLNQLPDPIAKTIRAGSQEAYSAVNAARAQQAGSTNLEAEIRANWARLIALEEERKIQDADKIRILNKIADERERAGVGMGGGR